MIRFFTIAAVFAAVAQCAAEPRATSAADLFQALRNGDTARAAAALKAGAPPDARNTSGDTALMHAALYAGADAVKLLLDAGADPRAANSAGATALMWAVPHEAKVRMLVERGADVNARSKEGRTALLVGARHDGAAPLVRYLLAKGADPKAADEAGGNALMLAAQAGDPETVRLLIARGVDVNAQAQPPFAAPRFGRAFGKLPPGAKGVTALLLAAANGNTECVRILLANGADPNLKAYGIATALTSSAWRAESEIARLLIDAGADVNAREMRGATPLILAAASDDAPIETIRLLLSRGADVAAKDAAGRTALQFAALRGDTPVTQLLRGTPASEPGAVPAVAPLIRSVTEDRAAVAQSVEKGLALLQTANTGFLKQSGCISCHNQSIPSMALAAARARGFRFDENLARRHRDAVATIGSLHRETMLQGVATIPASTIVSSYALIGLAAEGYAADAMTDALVHELAARQRRDGRFTYATFMENSRPPLDQGDITATVLTMRALQLYPLPGRKDEFAARIAKARAWLAAQAPRTSQERNMRLLGLAWTMADRAAIHAAAEQIMMEQRDDGGWSQLPLLTSDAYATGQALYALYESGVVKPSDPAYRRGVRFLLATQEPGGAWHVKSRALGFQPFFESGYPHGHDQWISAAGAGWATLALTLTAEPVTTVASR